MTVLADPVEETRRVIAAADAAGVPLRAMGGVAVALLAPIVGRLRPARTYHDLDLVTAAGQGIRLTAVLAELGYTPVQRFNALNGAERMLFHDPSGRRVDVFVDTVRMCHALRLGDRLDRHPLTLAPADLLLSKLQIVERTARDEQDVLALLVALPLGDDDAAAIALPRLRAVCAGDWGWWRTVDDSLGTMASTWEVAAGDADTDTGLEPEEVRRAADRARALRTDLASAPRSMAWRLRAAIGPRWRWYDLPEEVR
jgi:hypothetical protein